MMAPGTEGDQTPTISVILPVLNEARDIGRLLGEVLNQAPPGGGFEVLVADGGSTDGTRAIVEELARRWDNLRLLDNPKRISSAGRNTGMRVARGKYVLFLDGHCAIPRSDYFVRVAELFESTGAVCLCRPQPLSRLVDGPWAKAIAAARHSRWGHNRASDIYGGSPSFTDPRSAGAAYVREAVAPLGEYDERFDACEDVEFNCRVAEAGLRAYRHPDLAVDYRPRSSLAGLFRQMVRYGKGRAHLMARHPMAFPWSLGAITGFLMLVLAMLAWKGPTTAAVLAAVPFGCWFLVIAAESIRLGGVTGGGARTAAAFATIYLGLLVGFWRGVVDLPRYRSAGRS